MVESLDNSIGRIVAKLEERGIAENTIIILTGDNGGDHKETTGGLRAYRGWSHEGAVREPLIAKWPGKIAKGSTSDEMVIGMDFTRPCWSWRDWICCRGSTGTGSASRVC